MSPWPPEGEPQGKGMKKVTLPRPGHADLAGRAQVRPRRRPQLARARVGAAHGRARRGGRRREGAAPRDRHRGRGLDGRRGGAARARSTRRAAERDTVGGVVEVRARNVPPGLGTYAAKEDRLDARLAAAVMGIQAVKGVEIGEGFSLARQARARRRTTRSRPTGAGRRTTPAGSRRASRTARRSSSAPR